MEIDRADWAAGREASVSDPCSLPDRPHARAAAEQTTPCKTREGSRDQNLALC